MVRLFFDTETTGLPKSFRAPSTDIDNWPRLVQLSWILADEHKELSRADLIIKPDGFEIPEAASDVHGITTEMALKNGISAKNAVYYFLGAAKCANVLVGHNVTFDTNIVGSELVRAYGKDYIYGIPTQDTMKSSVDFCAIPGSFGFKYPKLIELYRKLFGHDFEDAHNSMADISATYVCYWKLVELGLIEKL